MSELDRPIDRAIEIPIEIATGEEVGWSLLYRARRDADCLEGIVYCDPLDDYDSFALVERLEEVTRNGLAEQETEALPHLIGYIALAIDTQRNDDASNTYAEVFRDPILKPIWMITRNMVTIDTRWKDDSEIQEKSHKSA